MADLRQPVLIEIASMRAGLLAARNGVSVPERVARLCDALYAWGHLPDRARLAYTAEILETIFDVAADVEEDDRSAERERLIVEVSLWDITAELNLDQADSQSAAFIAARRERILRTLKATATNQLEGLLYAWSLLLRHRATAVPTLPGAFAQDVADVVADVSAAGVPRRAQAIAAKFHAKLDPLVKLTLAHRSETDEIDRTKNLLQRLSSRLPLIPYSTLLRARAFSAVLAAPITAIPLSVSGTGCIVIGNQTFGATKRRC